MQLKPFPHFFIIKIDIEKQKERREKVGSLYVHYSHVHMQRNMQCGEIIAIGSLATKIFPEASIGHTLIFHHFIEGSEREKSSFIYADNEFIYYTVTAKEFNGRRSETYGVYDGEKIIPHPEFIFVEPKEKEKEISADEFITKNTKQVGSLILFNDWEDSRETLEERAQQITAEIKFQSQGKSMSDSTKRGLEEKQNQAANITASLSKTKYSEYKISYSNPSLKRKDTVFSLNAAPVEIEFMDKNYLVINKKHCVGTM